MMCVQFSENIWLLFGKICTYSKYDNIELEIDKIENYILGMVPSSQFSDSIEGEEVQWLSHPFVLHNSYLR